MLSLEICKRCKSYKDRPFGFLTHPRWECKANQELADFGRVRLNRVLFKYSEVPPHCPFELEHVVDTQKEKK